MRRTPLILLGFLVLAMPALAGGYGATLREVSRTPLQLQGRSFRAGERVTVRVTARGATTTAAVKAGSSGTFVLRFDQISLGRCGSAVVKAIGSRGSVATLKQTPRMACMPA
jgi:hypothetical protein